MSTTSVSMPDAPSAAPLSEPQRIINVFVAPRKTFGDIRRSAIWVGPFLLMAVFSFAYSFTVGKKIGFEQVAQTQARFSPASQQARMEALPPDEKAKAEQRSVTITKFISYGFSVLSLAFLAIVALVLWGTFNFGTGADMRFGQALAIVIYASLPGIIRVLLAMAVIGFGAVDPENFMIQIPIGSNPAYYMSFADTPRFLWSIAASLDLFTIWTLVLTAIGFAVVTKKSTGTAAAVVFGWYAVWTLATAALGAAFS